MTNLKEYTTSKGFHIRSYELNHSKEEFKNIPDHALTTFVVEIRKPKGKSFFKVDYFFNEAALNDFIKRYL
jgi:hypothetical protein